MERHHQAPKVTGNRAFTIIPRCQRDSKSTKVVQAVKSSPQYLILKWFYNKERHMDQWTLADLRDELVDYMTEQDVTANVIYYSSSSRMVKHTFVSFEIDGKFYTDEQCKSTPIKGLIHNLTVFKLHADYGLAGGSQVQQEAGGFCSIF
ncbi:UNKNOWN [Stylonychia lemnae]|uniref:Uncharacterized protein n=1 Tax=Stylonychia lemnae TaxID=5949 RepID=A0A078APW7_STYLE|nr:UNKNOWN [Stylonychia lemnae]|eukprot:CDW84209.1 UNKNOWN [Stylonychia lemnae]